MSACCKVLAFCQKCDCEKKQGLADAIAKPILDPAALVREVPQARDDCACGASGGVNGGTTQLCSCEDPDIEPIIDHILNFG